ncbi:MAG: XdhC family protein [Gammaproteobacteria bacterium]|nr:XdhC family protein [Gammaproteobacteria bacterium]MBV9725372.1 XdhC family protein [Gammaproteobacteria bacterium]
MEATLGPLLPLYERERAGGRALALGVLLRTEGSTYRKPGALILIAGDGQYAGLISGGCLESDLREHARAVIASGTARNVRYDARTEDDLVFGLGLGCEGAMDILLLQTGPTNGWQPLAHLAAALAAHRETAVGLVVDSSHPEVPVGAVALPEDEPGGAAVAWPLAASPLAASPLRVQLRRAAVHGETAWVEQSGWKLFVLPLDLPPRILLLGAGPDAVPVAALAARLSWKVTVADHRAAYADANRFPGADRVLLVRPEALPQLLELHGFAAAIVMSHHLLSDLAYLRALAPGTIPYVGLLGPAVRRERLLSELGAQAALLQGRLHAPVGLALGGRSPESIALAIVAQLHAFLHGVL